MNGINPATDTIHVHTNAQVVDGDATTQKENYRNTRLQLRGPPELSRSSSLKRSDSRTRSDDSMKAQPIRQRSAELEADVRYWLRTYAAEHVAHVMGVQLCFGDNPVIVAV